MSTEQLARLSCLRRINTTGISQAKTVLGLA